jgi:rhodanese-related sulfurtransferase
MRRLILLAGCIGVLAVTVVAQHSSRFMQMLAEARRNVREVSVEEVKARLDRSEKFLLIDVREDNEWAEGHVPGAIHIGRGVLEKGIEEKAVDGKTPIVLYCHSGARSALAADTLQKMGYTNVASMAGGTSAWREKGFPLEK